LNGVLTLIQGGNGVDIEIDAASVAKLIGHELGDRCGVPMIISGGMPRFIEETVSWASHIVKRHSSVYSGERAICGDSATTIS